MTKAKKKAANPQAEPKESPAVCEETISLIPVSRIIPSPMNSRRRFVDIEELMKSIVATGLLQPVSVRKENEQGMFELIAGERRLKAMQLGIEKGELTIDYRARAIINDVTDEVAMQIMLIENLQRNDLTPYETAEGFVKYAGTLDNETAIRELADKTGFDARYIRARMKAMSLPAPLIEAWKNDVLTYAHLEQFSRLEKERILEFFAEATKYKDNVWSVANLRDSINRTKALLSSAFFSIKDEGCTKCRLNSQVQASLFGEDFKADKVSCMNITCFFREADQGSCGKLAGDQRERTQLSLFERETARLTYSNSESNFFVFAVDKAKAKRSCLIKSEAGKRKFPFALRPWIPLQRHRSSRPSTAPDKSKFATTETPHERSDRSRTLLHEG